MFLVALGIIYIVISFLARRKYSLSWGLIIILLAMGLQTNVPGDYDRYAFAYNEIETDLIDFHSLRSEIGWGYLNYFFSRFVSFKIFIFFLSFFEVCVLARFIKRYTDKRFMFLSGLIFYFSLNMMLFQMKGLRQGLAIEICLIALIYLDRLRGIKQIVFPILIVFLASTIHMSSFLMVPIIVLWIVIQNSKWVSHKCKDTNYILPLLFSCLYFYLFLIKAELIESNKLLLTALNLQGKEGYFAELISIDYNPLITIYGALLVFAVSFFMQQESGFRKFLSLIVLISLYLEMFTFGAGNLFRLTLYYGIISIVVLPNVASFLYRKEHHVLAWLFTGLVISYNFRSFITQTIRNSEDGFDNYTFIFLKLLE